MSDHYLLGTAAPLTRESLIAALEHAREVLLEDPLRPHQHVVHPRSEPFELYGRLWLRCADCMAPFPAEWRDERAT